MSGRRTGNAIHLSSGKKGIFIEGSHYSDIRAEVNEEWNMNSKDRSLPEHETIENRRSIEMGEIKNNEVDEVEKSPRECETKEDFDKAMEKKEGELKFDIETSRQERNRAEYKADKLGSITEEEKRENAEKRQEALEAKRQDYQDAVWKKEGEEWKKNEINDPKQKEKVDQAEKDWEAQIKSNKRQEMIDEKRPVEEKPDIKPDTGGIESGNERTRERTEVNNQEKREDENKNSDTSNENKDQEKRQELTREQLEAINARRQNMR